jgi:[NiFe] hydrogenase assembly HybE family chaperone
MAEESNQERLERLMAAYRKVDLNMRSVPIYNDALTVEAVGFVPHGAGLIGMVVTPWFMNLVHLPLPGTELPENKTREVTLPGGKGELKGARLEGAPAFEFSHVISPMGAFGSQEYARAVAQEALRSLFPAPAQPAPVARPEPKPQPSGLGRVVGRKGLFDLFRR